MIIAKLHFERLFHLGHYLYHLILFQDVLKLDLNKQNQTSDWGNDNLTENQLDYAANDVLYLHEIKNKLDKIIEREGKQHLAKACFEFLSTRAEFDLLGWQDKDIFEHK